MTDPHDLPPPADEADAERRWWILGLGALSLDLVSALAGDRPLSADERTLLDDLHQSRGPNFYSDLLYAITHQYFAPDEAEGHWREILQHKYKLSGILGRNVRIVVAALDYLSNITTYMDSATLVDEEHLDGIVELSLRDGLTGLFNHTYFYQQIDFEVRRYVRYGTPVSLVLVDIDDFKAVNDTFGHRQGDRILAAMGRTLMRVSREADVCCRYGGEEFAVILPMTDATEARAIAVRLNRELAERLPDGRTVTVSIGVASCGKKTGTSRELVERADAALYQVKRSGKNRVLVAADAESGPEAGGQDRIIP